jgi:AcrR family transcriptional regulator
MKATTGDPKAQLTRECIFTALMILMEKKSFEEISITEITHKAGVSRMSYYRHYKSKDDIIGTYLDELFDEYLNHIVESAIEDPYGRKYCFVAFLKENERIIKNLLRCGSSPCCLTGSTSVPSG